MINLSKATIDMNKRKRCNCQGGECWECLKDIIDDNLIRYPNSRSCLCGHEMCAVCNYMKKIGKFKESAE